MKPRVVRLPHALAGLQRGIAQVVAAVRPTLGPRPRVVAVQRPHRSEAPELLDDAGLIARRLAQLADRDADMGAMLVRQVLWRQRQRAGDGAATTAVLYQALFDAGLRHLAAGGNAMRLRAYLDAHLPALLDALRAQAEPLAGRPALEQLAGSICPDPVLPPLLAEVFDVLGEQGHLAVRLGRGRETEREYIEGAYWEGGLTSRRLIAEPARQRSELLTPAVLITDLELNDPPALLPVLLDARAAGHASLVIVARTTSEEVVTLLASAGRPPASFPVLAVKTPGTGAAAQAAALEDLAVLTGGRFLAQAAGAGLAGITAADLGRARRAWADLEYFGLVGGQGDPRAVRAHLAHLEVAWGRAQDQEPQEALLDRIGRLRGGSATLLVGGVTEAEIKLRREQAERAARVLRGAVRAGVVPGGGAALLACRPALRRRLKSAADEDERAALRGLLLALEAPARALLANAGFDPSVIGPQLAAGLGCDVRSGAVTDLRAAGVWDSAAVLTAAVHSAVAGAGLALTVETLVQRASPPVASEP